MKKYLGLALTLGVLGAALAAPWLAASDPMTTRSVSPGTSRARAIIDATSDAAPRTAADRSPARNVR